MRKNTLFCRFIFFCCTLAVMTIIFIFSSQNGETSSEVSGKFSTFVREILEKILPSDAAAAIVSYIRKMAHVFLYACLGAVSSCFFFTFSFRNRFIFIVVPWLFCLAYACGDEFHQYFVPGRTCSLTDVCVDGIGFTFTILLACLIRAVAHGKRIKKKTGGAE